MRITSFLPSKTFSVVATIITIGVLGATFILQKNVGVQTPVTQTYTDTVSPQEAFLRDTQKDSDNDGLKDWEEVLWNTDPHNPDTDGDGITDKEDVANRTVTHTQNTKQPTISQSTTTQTKKFAQDLFIRYATLENQGALQDGMLKSDIQQLFDPVFASAFTEPSAKKYTLTDITTVPETSSTLLHYTNNLTPLLKKSIAIQIPLATLQFTGNASFDADSVSALVTASNQYNELQEALVAVPVPQSLSTYHVDLINIVGRLAADFKGVSVVYTDSIQTIGALLQISDDFTAFKKTLNAIQTYLITHDIVLSISS